MDLSTSLQMIFNRFTCAYSTSTTEGRRMFFSRGTKLAQKTLGRFKGSFRFLQLQINRMCVAVGKYCRVLIDIEID